MVYKDCTQEMEIYITDTGLRPPVLRMGVGINSLAHLYNLFAVKG